MTSRPRLTLRSMIALIISAAALVSTAALALIAFAAVHANEAGYSADIKQRQVYFAHAAAAYVDLLHADVENWIRRQPVAPTEAATAAYVRRVSRQVRKARGLPYSVEVAVIDPADAGGCHYTDDSSGTACRAGVGKYVTRGDLDYTGSTSFYAAVLRLTGTAQPVNLVVVAPSASGPPVRGTFTWPALAVVAFATVLALVIGLRVGQSVRRPLRRTALAARRFGAGEHSVRVPIHGTDELADLGRSFNAMADQLAATLDDLHRSQSVQRRFVADVSHELRSPFATMLAAVQGLHGDERTRERSAALLDVQATRLAGILEDLLEISRFDAGQASLVPEEADVVDIVTDAVDTVAPRSPVPVTARGRTVACVDARRIHTVVRNLVANAVHHGTPPIWVDVDGTEAEWITIQVADGGPGIDSEHAESVFERFVRGDAARSSGDGGAGGASSGLGLAIAAENARLHDGTLAVLPDPPTRFVLRLPRTARGELHDDQDETAT